MIPNLLQDLIASLAICNPLGASLPVFPALTDGAASPERKRAAHRTDCSTTRGNSPRMIAC